MQTSCFRDFDAFAESVRGVECKMLLQSPQSHFWSLSLVDLPGVRVQLGRLGSGNIAEDSKKGAVRVTRSGRAVRNRLRRAVGQIMAAAANCPQFESAPAATSAAARLLEIASPVIGQQEAGEPRQEGRPRLSREEIIRRAMERLEERDGQRVLVEELATAADVSERTLRTAFNEYYGIGPIRYLQILQHHQIRRALKAADPEAVSVGDVLVAHGEWEFSRFADRYCRLFGERPSETLRK